MTKYKHSMFILLLLLAANFCNSSNKDNNDNRLMKNENENRSCFARWCSGCNCFKAKTKENIKYSPETPVVSTPEPQKKNKVIKDNTEKTQCEGCRKSIKSNDVTYVPCCTQAWCKSCQQKHINMAVEKKTELNAIVEEKRIPVIPCQFCHRFIPKSINDYDYYNFILEDCRLEDPREADRGTAGCYMYDCQMSEANAFTCGVALKTLPCCKKKMCQFCLQSWVYDQQDQIVTIKQQYTQEQVTCISCPCCFEMIPKDTSQNGLYEQVKNSKREEKEMKEENNILNLDNNNELKEKLTNYFQHVQFENHMMKEMENLSSTQFTSRNEDMVTHIEDLPKDSTTPIPRVTAGMILVTLTNHNNLNGSFEVDYTFDETFQMLDIDDIMIQCGNMNESGNMKKMTDLFDNEDIVNLENLDTMASLGKLNETGNTPIEDDFLPNECMICRETYDEFSREKKVCPNCPSAHYCKTCREDYIKKQEENFAKLAKSLEKRKSVEVSVATENGELLCVKCFECPFCRKLGPIDEEKNGLAFDIQTNYNLVQEMKENIRNTQKTLELAYKSIDNWEAISEMLNKSDREILANIERTLNADIFKSDLANIPTSDDYD